MKWLRNVTFVELFLSILAFIRVAFILNDAKFEVAHVLLYLGSTYATMIYICICVNALYKEVKENIPMVQRSFFN